MCNSLWSQGLQHVRLPCPSLSPGVCSNSSPMSWLCYLNISPSVTPLLLLPSIFPSIRVFSNELALCIRLPKYWSFSFSINPFKEYSELISFRTDLCDLLAVQEILKSLLAPQFESINSSVLNFLYSPTLTSIHDYWKSP